MKLRCDLQINDGKRRLILVPYESELPEHLALRLAACVLFWNDEPSAELSSRHPALADQEFRPDCIALDEAGRVKLWVECGRTTPNKLDKLTKRYHDARLVVLTGSEHDARRMRETIDAKVSRGAALELWSWKAAEFQEWCQALREDTYVVGESDGRSLNLVINDVPLAVELDRF
ncbi:MAG: YaeQ family protein [Elusimicrobia bacterium]|nr:YaeQ family protein [Elusimicrobiota bacterium]